MQKVLLLILDGFGIGDKSEKDAIFQAKTPFIDNLKKDYPNSKLSTTGEDVGLPAGQMGNSEVGHLNIGAGRVVYQDFVKINKDIQTNKIINNKNIKKAFSLAKKGNRNLHFIGLLSDGGVHSHQDHLHKLCDIADDYGLENVFVHAITDGRDTDPKSGVSYIKKLQKHIKNSTVKLASVIGRFYAMDRDNRWERIKIAYEMLINGQGTKTNDFISEVQNSYKEGITDEFLKATVKTDKNNNPIGRIKADDVLIFFNFRNDRARELTKVLTQEEMKAFGMSPLPLHYFTMTLYDAKFKGLNVIYEKTNPQNTLGEIIANNGLKQLRIAETEKYAHVSFFFSGGREETFSGEERILVPSPKVETYDLQPEMSANEVADKLTTELNKNKFDFICCNFANCDMVGHTGVFDAIIKAVETIDTCVKKVVIAAKQNNYAVMIIADHGNADYVKNEDGSPNTSHSTNPVPCILISDNHKKMTDGILSDVAPTILNIMGVDIPEEMTGKLLNFSL